MCTFSSPAREITALGSVAWETTVLNQGSKAGRLKYYSRKSSPRIIVTMDIVSILAYFAIFVAHIYAGEGQGWTVVCGAGRFDHSWTSFCGYYSVSNHQYLVLTDFRFAFSFF